GQGAGGQGGRGQDLGHSGEDTETRRHEDAETSQSPHLLISPPPHLPTHLILDAIAQNPTAAHHQEALQALQRIEQLQQQQAPQKAIAAAYYAIGRLYRDHLEQGSVTGTLTLAIQFHEQTLVWLEEDSTLWSDVLNDLGNLYWMQAHDAVGADLQLASLEQAVQVYEQALSKTSSQNHPQTYAMIQNNLGSAFGDLAQYREPAENLRKSVLAYETALRYRSLNDDPARYAATQNNLGTTCWNLAQHQQPVAHLTQAIAAYQEAVRYYTAEREPLHYAMIQNNLGTAFWNLAQHTKSGSGSAKPDSASPETLLRQAIAAYQNALIYRTLDAAPAAYAATQNNLGTAHWNLATLSNAPQEERREQLQQATTAYEAAITAVETLSTRTGQRPALTFDVFATHNNLGLAYYQLAIDQHSALDPAKRQKYLERSLKSHLQALQNWEPLSDFYQSTLDHVIQTVRTFYTECGIQGQNLALSQIPAHLLPEIMRRL
ncbi:MAG: tetratricopeptide repeat protein, partial [Leptolyngbyaceae cyanobacterium RU_5_1]|nr:tetratricopeptide repeat protein [Leptolyngbyaceae cyanobacterium RU_5_1]